MNINARTTVGPVWQRLAAPAMWPVLVLALLFGDSARGATSYVGTVHFRYQYSWEVAADQQDKKARTQYVIDERGAEDVGWDLWVYLKPYHLDEEHESYVGVVFEEGLTLRHASTGKGWSQNRDEHCWDESIKSWRLKAPGDRLDFFSRETSDDARFEKSPLEFRLGIDKLQKQFNLDQTVTGIAYKEKVSYDINDTPACTNKPKVDHRGTDIFCTFPGSYLYLYSQPLPNLQRIQGRKVEDQDYAKTRNPPRGVCHSYLQVPDRDLKAKHSGGERTWEWDLHRVDSDCPAFVMFTAGTVTINGQKLDKGPLPNPNGALLQTGAKSRVRIDFPEAGISFRLGSNTSIKLPDRVCKGEQGDYLRLLRGRLYALFSKIISGPSRFEVQCGNMASGIRGEVPSCPGGWRAKVQLASFASGPPPALPPKLNEEPDVAPTKKEIDRVPFAFAVEKSPGEFLQVRAIRGTLRLKDSSGLERILNAGQDFSKQWQPGVDAGPEKEVFIIVDRR